MPSNTQPIVYPDIFLVLFTVLHPNIRDGLRCHEAKLIHLSGNFSWNFAPKLFHIMSSPLLIYIDSLPCPYSLNFLQ